MVFSNCTCGHCTVCRVKRSLHRRRPSVSQPAPASSDKTSDVQAGPPAQQYIWGCQETQGLTSKEYNWAREALELGFLSDKERDYLEKRIKEGTTTNPLGPSKSSSHGDGDGAGASDMYLSKAVPGTQLTLKKDPEADGIVYGRFSFDMTGIRNYSMDNLFHVPSRAAGAPQSEKPAAGQSALVRDLDGEQTLPSRVPSNSPASHRPIAEQLQDSVPDVTEPLYADFLTDGPEELEEPEYRSNSELLEGSEPDETTTLSSDLTDILNASRAYSGEGSKWDDGDSFYSMLDGKVCTAKAIANVVGQRASGSYASRVPISPPQPKPASPVLTKAEPSDPALSQPNHNSPVGTQSKRSLTPPENNWKGPLFVRRGQAALPIINPATGVVVSGTYSPAPVRAAGTEQQALTVTEPTPVGPAQAVADSGDFPDMPKTLCHHVEASTGDVEKAPDSASIEPTQAPPVESDQALPESEVGLESKDWSNGSYLVDGDD